MTLQRLPHLLIEDLVRNTLLEDLGRAGDITTDAIVPADARATTNLVARQPGVVAGLDLAALAFRLVDPAIVFTEHKQDGSRLSPGDVIATVSGPARGMLTAERTALNFLCRLSGIASSTAQLVEAVAGTKTRITCTRKTTPLMRTIEKYAVRCGGGANHRFGLDDAVLIKDNHVAVAGSVSEAIRRARAHVGHLVKIEVEVDTLAQFEEALSVGADVVLLDNMGPDLLRQAVAINQGRAILEASGRITRETAAAIAASGVDLIACGWITHSAPILDIGLDYQD